MPPFNWRSEEYAYGFDQESFETIWYQGDCYYLGYRVNKQLGRYINILIRLLSTSSCRNSQITSIARHIIDNFF